MTTDMLIFSEGLGHRHLSDMRAAVCLILGPVFVLWFETSSAEEAVRMGVFMARGDFPK
jgi:hypothetical protein